MTQLLQVILHLREMKCKLNLPHKNVYTNVHRSITHHSQKVSRNKPNAHQTDKWINVIYLYDGILFINEKKCACYMLLRAWILKMLNEKSQSQRTTYYMSSLIWNIQNRQIRRQKTDWYHTYIITINTVILQGWKY